MPNAEFRGIYGLDEDKVDEFMSTFCPAEDKADVLLALRFAKQYPTYLNRSATEFRAADGFHGASRQLGRRSCTSRVFRVMTGAKPNMLASLTFDTSVSDELECALYRHAPFLLDATHVPIKRFCGGMANRASYRMRFHSWKLRGMALSYQVVYNPWSSHICDVYGPFPASVHDSIAYRASGVGRRLREMGRKCMADGGYAGFEGELETPYARRRPLTAEETQHNFHISTVRWQVETVFSRAKAFRALSEEWRHDIGKHHLVFFFIVGVLQIDLKHHPLERHEM